MHKFYLRPLLMLALLLLSACAGLGQRYESVRVSLVGLEVTEVQLFEQRYGLTLRVQNPNSAALSIDGLSFEVKLNGKPFAHGVSNQAVEIPAYGEEVLKMNIVSSLFRVVDQLRALEQQNGKPVSYRISGHVGLAGGLGRIPFDQQGEFGGGQERQPAPGGDRRI